MEDPDNQQSLDAPSGEEHGLRTSVADPNTGEEVSASFDAPDEQDLARVSVIENQDSPLDVEAAPEDTAEDLPNSFDAPQEQDFSRISVIENQDSPQEPGSVYPSSLNTYYNPDDFDQPQQNLDEPPSSPVIPPYEGPPDLEPTDYNSRFSLPPHPDHIEEVAVIVAAEEELTVLHDNTVEETTTTTHYEETTTTTHYEEVEVQQDESDSKREELIASSKHEDVAPIPPAVYEEVTPEPPAQYEEVTPEPPSSPPPDRITEYYDEPINVSSHDVQDPDHVVENEIHITDTQPVVVSEPAVVVLASDNNNKEDVTWQPETQAPGHSLASYSYTTNQETIEMVEIVPGTQVNGRMTDKVEKVGEAEDPEFFFKAKSPTNMNVYFGLACLGFVFNILFGSAALYIVQKGRDSSTVQQARKYGCIAVVVAFVGLLVTVGILLAVGFTRDPAWSMG